VPQFGGSEEQMSKNGVAIASSVLLAFVVARAASAEDTRIVSVDGHAMRVQTAGLNHTPKSPGIVFESGAGMGLTAWSTGELPDVGQFARAVAYDRAGIGLSDVDGQPPTPRHVAQRLRRLLTQMDFQPPYILVGHSWGGPLIRMFAALYPRDVAGLVYVDSTAVRSEQQHLEYLRAIGHTTEGARREIDRSREQMESFVRSRTGPYRAERPGNGDGRDRTSTEPISATVLEGIQTAPRRRPDCGARRRDGLALPGRFPTWSASPATSRT